MYSNDPLEAAYIDEYLETVEEILMLLVPSFRESDPAKKKQLREEFAQKTVPHWIGNLEKRLSQTGTEGHSVGDKLSVADFKIGEKHHFLTFFLERSLLQLFSIFILKQPLQSGLSMVHLMTFQKTS